MEAPRKPLHGLMFLVIATLALGIFFRVTNISQKVYWHDEVFTSIRAAGYTGEEIIAEVFTGIPISPNTLLQYQKLNPERNWGKNLVFSNNSSRTSTALLFINAAIYAAIWE